MASPNTSPMVYGPNVAQVKPIIQKPPISSPVSPVPAVSLLQPVSTSGQSSQLCGQSMLTLGVTPGRYRYNTASMNGKQGVVMFPMSNPTDAGKNNFFVPFTQNPTSGTTVSPQTIITQSDLKKPIPYWVPPKGKVPPSAIPMILDNNLKNIYRTQTGLRPSMGLMGSAARQEAPPIKPMFAPSSLIAVPSTPNLACGNTQQRFPLVLVSKSTSVRQNTPVVNFVIAKGSPLTAVASSVVGNVPNSQSKTIATASLIKNAPSPFMNNVTNTGAKIIVTNAIVKTEPPDSNKPVGTLLIKKSHDRSSVSAVTFPSTAIARMSHCASHIKVHPNATRMPVQTYYSSSKKPHTSPKTPHKPPKTIGSNVSPGTPCATHTSWSALKPVGVPEENPSLAVINTTDNVLPENVNTLTEDDNDMPFKIESVFSLCGSNFTAEEGFIQPEGEPGGTENDPELTEGEPEVKQDGAHTKQDELKVKEKKLKTNTSCKYNEVCFPVIERIKLQGLPTIDVRKLRKLTGRQSCSQKCRENTVKRYCGLNKLCIKEKPFILDFPLLTDIKMETEELQQFEDFLKVCKPAPRSQKLVLFRHDKYSTKVKIPHETKVKIEPPVINSEEEFVAFKKRKKKKKKKKRSLELKDLEDGEILVRVKNSTATLPAKTEQVLPKKSISLLNPGGNPTPGWLTLDPSKAGAAVQKQVITAPHRVITTLNQVIKAPHRVITAQNQVITAPHRVITTQNQVITAPQRVITAQNQVITAPPRVITAPPTPVGKAAAPKSIKPLLDTNSPTFQKAISALGSKKFFLLRVEGKNILMPVDQNSVLPRAYVLGDTTAGVSSQMYSPITTAEPQPAPIAKPSMNTQIRVKTEPPDAGYETPVVSITNNKPTQPEIIPSRVKPEPMGRGYADEINPTLTSPSKLAYKSHSDITTALTTKETDFPIPSTSDRDEFNRPSTYQTSTVQATPQLVSSADRIRQLKELLKQNEEDLVIIKKRRIEEAVDVSGILDDTEM